jgi:hypothetical protein
MESDAYALSGWAGDPNWLLDTGRDYPRLVWEDSPGQSIVEPVLNDRLAGSGTVEDPYRVATPDQLALVGTASILWDKAIVLTADLDVNGVQVQRIGIGPGSEFRGSFDGRGHAVRNLVMDAGDLSVWWMALFGWVHVDGRISDLNLAHAVIRGGGQRSGYLGALAGLNRGTISNCIATNVLVEGRSTPERNATYLGGLIGCNDGSVDHCRATGNVNADWEVGGLVGLNYGSILRCRADTTVLGRRATMGGLAGCNYGQSVLAPGAVAVVTRAVIKDSCATGQVAGDEDSGEAGGLVGVNVDGEISGCYATSVVNARGATGGLVGVNASDAIITNSYARGDVIGRSAVGGLVGSNGGTITSSYAIGNVLGEEYLGGLAGPDQDGTIAESFWDTQTSCLSESAGGTGKTTAEMQMADTFIEAGWDFVGETGNGTEDVWWIDEGKDYPRLWWERDEEATLSGG